MARISHKFVLFLLLLLIGSYFVFYPVCLFFRDVDVQLSHQCFGDRSGSLEMFSFPFLVIFASCLSSILLT